MNYFLRLSVLSLFVCAGVQAAEVSSSQYQHQANQGIFEVTPSVTFGAIKYHYNSSNTDFTNTTNSMFGFNVTGEYGISEQASVGVRLGYQKDNYAPGGTATAIANIKGDGMTDPDIFVNARWMVGGGSLRYGANFSFSLADQNLNDPSANSYTGGYTLTPYVGYEYAMLGGMGGARVTYDVYQSDRNWTVQGQSGKVKGGNELTATLFYEITFNPVLIGVDVGLMSYASSKFTGGSSDNSLSTSYVTGKVDVYAAYYVAHDIAILPAIGYGTLDTGSQLGRIGLVGTKNSGGVYGTLAARFGF